MVNTYKWSAHRSLEIEIWIIQMVNVQCTAGSQHAWIAGYGWHQRMTILCPDDPCSQHNVDSVTQLPTRCRQAPNMY